MRQRPAAGRKGAVLLQDVWIVGADQIERYSCG